MNTLNLRQLMDYSFILEDDYGKCLDRISKMDLGAVVIDVNSGVLVGIQGTTRVNCLHTDSMTGDRGYRGFVASEMSR